MVHVARSTLNLRASFKKRQIREYKRAQCTRADLRYNIFDAVKNSAPDIFNFVKSKMGFNAQLLTMTTTKASNAAVASRIMADNKIDTSKRDKESSSSGFLSTTMTTRKAKPLLLKIVASNSSNVIKKPRIIFNG
uniref:Uncharacterized protein n=1 Tax=Romanomermis culicivorax TaxID=13658 RepID=A0A915KJL0_ROMCU